MIFLLMGIGIVAAVMCVAGHDAGIGTPDAAARPTNGGAAKDSGLAAGIAADKNFSANKAVGTACATCPLNKIKLVELVEVVQRKTGKKWAGLADQMSEGTVGGATADSTDKAKPKITDRTDFHRNCYRQYINLDKDWPEGKEKRHPEYGRYIELRVRVAWVTQRKDSLSGKKVYWTFTHTAVDGRPRDLKDSEKEGFNSAGGHTAKVSTTDQWGWTPIMKFYLSQYGGDKFSVTVQADEEDQGKPSGKKHSTKTYQVWQRMWYQITEMDQKTGPGRLKMPSGVMTGVRKSFADVFIEMNDSGEFRTGGSGRNFKENFPAREDGFKWADKFCTRKCTPWKMHLVVVNHSADKMHQEITIANISSRNAFQIPSISFRPYDFDGTNWIVRAQYRYHFGIDWKDFPPNHVTLAGTKPYNHIRVDFKTDTIRPTRNMPATVRIEYLKAKTALGWGGTCLHLLICRAEFDEHFQPGQIPGTMTEVCVHEPGHSFGLVYDQPWKTRNRAQSAHCRFNNCVMWYQCGVGSPTTFHRETVGNPGCRTYMRRLDMSYDEMKDKWKFPR